MILQALKEYYDRKSADPKSGIAPPGWEWKEIPYLVVLSKDGEIVDLECTVEGTGKTKTTKRFLIPQTVKRTVGVAANLLWDTPEYTLGIASGKGKGDRVIQQHDDFKRRVAELDIDDVGIKALKLFLDRTDKESLVEKFPEWANLKKEGAFLTFRLDGTKGIIADSPAMKKALTPSEKQTNGNGFCLITGEQTDIERLHASIKGVWGGNTSGGTIVGFNLDSFCSYGKKQGENAPVGKEAVFAYTTALNTMLTKGSKNRMQVGDASTVAWASTATPLEDHFFSAFSEPPKDNPDEGVEAVEAIFESLKSGAYAIDKTDAKFYVLGLAPNAARISIRFWQEATLEEIATRVTEHFKATEIERGPKQPKYLSLFRLLVSTATLGKSENIPPNLGGDVMRAILAGLPYPESLLQAAIRRNRAEQEVTYPRAAIIKACLNKKCKKDNPDNENHKFKELDVSLDKENKNIGYLLGRLFFMLLCAQKAAETGGNKITDIKDAYYGAASSTPSLVFPTLMRKLQHHLSKIAKSDSKKWLGEHCNRVILEILDKISGKEGEAIFPEHLSLDYQGCFAIGYYHQVQDFYRKKDKPEETPLETTAE